MNTLTIALVVGLACVAIVHLFFRKKKQKHRSKDVPVEVLTEPDLSYQRAEAVRAAADQSLKLNLMAQDAFREMVETAKYYHYMTLIHGQNTNWYRRAEFGADNERQE